MAFPVEAALNAAPAIAQTISNIVDQGKRRQFEQNIAQLSNSQRNALEKQMLEANTDTERLAILSNSMLQFAIRNQESINAGEQKLYWIAGILAVVLLGGAILVSRQK